MVSGPRLFIFTSTDALRFTKEQSIMTLSVRKHRLATIVRAASVLVVLGTCAGLAGTMHANPPKRATFRLLRVVLVCTNQNLGSGEPTNQPCPPSHTVVRYELTGRARRDAFVAALSVDPPVLLKVQEGPTRSGVASFLVGGAFTENTVATLRLAQTLRAVDGETLPGSFSHTVRVGRYVPSFRLPVGTALLPRGVQFPIEAHWTTALKVRALSIAPAELHRAWSARQGYEDDVFGKYFPDAATRVRETTISLQRSHSQHAELDPFALAGGEIVLLSVAADGEPPVYTLVQRADLGVVFKSGPTSGLAWVTDTATGDPVAGAEVSVWSSGVRRLRLTTDADGLVRLPGQETLAPPEPARGGDTAEETDHADGDDARESVESVDERYLTRAAIVVVEKGPQQTFAIEEGEFQDAIAPWMFELPSWGSSKWSMRGTVVSERGIYRAGDTVHFLAVVRQRAADGTLRPFRGALDVRIANPDYQEAHTARVTTTAFGTARFDFTVPRSAKLGAYEVRVSEPLRRGARHAEFAVGTRFEVAEYRPATFEVRLGASDVREEAEAYSVNASAAFFYGAPVRAGTARFTVHAREAYLEVAGFESFHFLSKAFGSGTDSKLVLDQERPLDSNGNASLRLDKASLREQWPTGAQVVDVDIAAIVTDANENARVGRTVQRVWRADAAVGIENTSWVVDSRAGWDVRTVVVGKDGRALAGRTVVVDLLKRTWVSTATGRAGDPGYQYSGHYVEAPVSSRTLTSSGEPVSVRFALPSAGDYIARASLGDGSASQVGVWAYGAEPWVGPSENTQRIELKPDRQSYAPGDTARLIAASPYSESTALFTVEREGIMDARVVRLSGAATPFVLPLGEQHAPTVFASVVLIPRGLGVGSSPAATAPFRMGATALKVSVASRKLHVQVRPQSAELEPGQRARVEVQVRDADGRPVRGEVTLWAADEGVLQLTGYKTPDIFEPLYQQEGWLVRTATNLLRWTTHSPETWNEGGYGDAAGEPAQALRSRFLDTAFWGARGVITNDQGIGHVEFDVPDNLTRWRVMAAVADDGQRFGSGEAAITVKKPVQLMAGLPRFAINGDRLQTTMLVQNESGERGRAVLETEVIGAQLETAHATQAVDLEVGAQRSLPIHIQIDSAVQSFKVRSRLRFVSEAGRTHQDGLELEIPVHPPTTRSVLALGEGTIQSGTSLSIQMPPHIAPGEAKLIVAVSSTPLASIERGIEWLLDYPYGCAEQTASRLAGMLYLESVLTSIGDPRLERGRHRTLLQDSVDRLVKFQNEDGGFGLWQGTHADPFVTALALFALDAAKDRNYRVQPSVLVGAGDFLRVQASGAASKFLGEDLSYFSAFALHSARQALVPLPPASIAAQQSRFGALLTAVIDPRARVGNESLLDYVMRAHSTSVTGSGTVVREAPRQNGYILNSYPDTRATALALVALVEANRMTEAHAVAAGLLSLRAEGTWGTTYDNFWALYALAKYARPLAKSPSAIAVSLDGRVAGTASLTRATDIQRIEIPFAGLPAAGRVGRLELRATNAGPYYSAYLEYAIPVEHHETINQGIQISRRYENAMTGQPIQQFRVGQIVRVRVRVTTTEEHDQVAINDWLPAGFEPVDTSLETERLNVDSTWQWSWRHREQHDDRVTHYSYELPAGRHEASYIARVARAGRFVVPPPTAEAMYRPAVRGSGEASVLEVLPRAE